MLSWLLACTVPVPDLARPTGDAPEIRPADPPPARNAAGERLYQLLYAGELGEDSRKAGDRARMAAWLDALALDETQLQGLAELVRAYDEARAANAADEAAVAEAEKRVLSPIYEELTARLTRPDAMGEEEAAAFAARIEAARAEVYGGKDFRAEHYRRVKSTLALCRPWVNALRPNQQAALDDARFVLGRRIGPFVNPGDYGHLVGTMWDGGDFGSLRATIRPTDEGHMDLGGLWSVEDMDAGPDRSLGGYQLEALLLMAFEDPALKDVIAARQAPGSPGGEVHPSTGG